MSTPFSWLGVGIASTPVLLKTLGAATETAGQIFGDLLSTKGPKASGLSGVNPTPTANSLPSPNDGNSLSSIVERLNQWLREKTSSQQGASELSEAALSIEVDADQSIRIQGPEPIRSDLERLVKETPSIRDGLVQAANQPSPLVWLPGATGTQKLRIDLPSHQLSGIR